MSSAFYFFFYGKRLINILQDKIIQRMKTDSMKIDKSIALFSEAQKYIPGGVNSPVRAFKSVGGNPIFFQRGEGSKLYDVDGNSYIDYVGSWGPHLFGHNPSFIKEALLKAVDSGTSFGAPAQIEVDMAKLVCKLIPSSAVRVARGYTGREKIIKFEGCYHGHADFFLIKAGSGALTFGVPTSPGVTKGNAADTLIADYNDLESVKQLIHENKDEIAAIIIEPVAGNMGVVKADKGFLEGIRALCNEHKIVLIFDEVMSGFRVAKGGAQEIFGIAPDLTTFGKIIGGGLPVGAFGGKREIMSCVSPAGPVYQAGTLSGNPLAMAAGFASLTYISEHPEVYKELEVKSAYLEKGYEENFKKLGVSFQINRVGSMMTLFFTPELVTGYKSATSSDTKKFAQYFNAMLHQGIYLPPAQFEALFVSSVHSQDDLDATIKANYESISRLI